MRKTSEYFGSDRFFLMLLITISVLLYSLIGGVEEVNGAGELMASTYPRVLLICMIVFSVIQFLNPNRAAHDKASFSLKGLAVIFIIAAYIFLLDIVGYFLLTPLMLFALPLLAGFRRYDLIILSVVLITISLYGVFKLVLNIPLPAGFLEV